jgi:hypothetical protein
MIETRDEGFGFGVFLAEAKKFYLCDLCAFA